MKFLCLTCGQEHCPETMPTTTLNGQFIITLILHYYNSLLHRFFGFYAKWANNSKSQVHSTDVWHHITNVLYKSRKENMGLPSFAVDSEFWFSLYSGSFGSNFISPPLTFPYTHQENIKNNVLAESNDYTSVCVCCQMYYSSTCTCAVEYWLLFMLFSLPLECAHPELVNVGIIVTSGVCG